jgi:hypothetical protein
MGVVEHPLDFEVSVDEGLDPLGVSSCVGCQLLRWVEDVAWPSRQMFKSTVLKHISQPPSSQLPLPSHPPIVPSTFEGTSGAQKVQGSEPLLAALASAGQLLGVLQEGVPPEGHRCQPDFGAGLQETRDRFGE